jgi:UDP-3-O-[3-hydroxymyristoyl] N-acetylglucosamine deacetylase/3-hydroxyacyl-[acyl-carrier-protein] dehydratase
MGVDNALIEMDASEPPIGDGSAAPYVELIKKAGVVEQSRQRRVYAVTEPIHLENEERIDHDRSCRIVRFRISCTQVGPDGRFVAVSSDGNHARHLREGNRRGATFVYYEDVKPLMDKGLIKGGSSRTPWSCAGTRCWARSRCASRMNSCGTRFSTSWATSRCSIARSRGTSSP